MSKTCLHINEYDPTRTLSLRNRFAAEMKRRFNQIAKLIKQAIEIEDVFNLIPESPEEIKLNLATPGRKAFAFETDQKKIDAFMKWLENQVRLGMLETGTGTQVGVSMHEAWTDSYIFDSYKRGVQRGRLELIKAKYPVPTIDQTGGIQATMSTPFHMDRIGLLYIRAYNDLQGITDNMNHQISRVLSQGMIDGDNPKTIAEKLQAVVRGSGKDLGITDTLGRYIPAERRAVMLARTEVIRAHHLATVQEYRNWGVLGVNVQAEFRTAGDKRVCSRCETFEKESPYTLDEIQGLIPAHPNCRCISIPIPYEKPKK
jgi:hypothetical protein